MIEIPIGRVIGQCKNCYYFGGYNNDKKKMIYYSKGRGMCQNSKDMDITHCHSKPDFGCINWKPRKSRRKIMINIKLK